MAIAPSKVVIVPGFGGTTLTYRGGFGGKTVYWYNPRALLSANPLAGALASDGVSPLAVFGKTLTPEGPVDFGLYEPLLTRLANGGWNPYFWGYDWRLSASVLAQNLASFLKTANLTNPFQLVCHSYGGLVAQLAYPIYQAAPGPNTWQRTVYAGTPHGGSYWAAAALAGWFPSGSELAVIADLFSLQIPIASLKSGTIVTATMALLSQLLGSWPGLYCLLPNYFGRWSSQDANAILLSEKATYGGTWGGTQDQWFNLFSVVANQLVQLLSLPRPSEVCLVGLGKSTLGGFDGGGALPSFVESYTTQDGDGTVTQFRATLPPPALYSLLEGVGHNGLVSTSAGTDTIVEALEGEQLSSETVPFVPPSTIPFPPSAFGPFSAAPVTPFGNLHSDP